MRAVFTLGGLVIVVGIMLWLFSMSSSTSLHEGKKAQDQVRQMSGHDESGEPADRSIKLDADAGTGTGPFRAMVVVDLTPGGAMEKFYGLKKGDKITAIGQNDVAIYNEIDMAKAMLLQEGFEKSNPITVIRDGQQIQLPEGKTATAGTGTVGQQQNSPPADSKPRSIEDQLKQIKIPGQ